LRTKKDRGQPAGRASSKKPKGSAHFGWGKWHNDRKGGGRRNEERKNANTGVELSRKKS